jgi:hypothetical protein
VACCRSGRDGSRPGRHPCGPTIGNIAR